MDPLFPFDDPIRMIANEILAENKRRDIALPWFVNEIVRRYQKRCPDRLDENLLRYSRGAGISGLARHLLKRDVRLLGFEEKVPERLLINKVYRPTLILTAAEIRENTRDKRRRIAQDVAKVRPLEHLADLVEAAGKQRVDEVFGEPALV